MKKRSIINPKKKLTGCYAKGWWRGRKRGPASQKQLKILSQYWGLRKQRHRQYMLAKMNVDNTKSHYFNPQSKSQKCFKQILNQFGINYIQYYIPSTQKFYELDFAILDKKIGLQINGQRHYNKKSKTLKKKYRIRHQFLQSIGWRIIQIFHVFAYKPQFVKREILSKLDDPELGNRMVMTFCQSKFYKKYPELKELITTNH